MIKQQKNTVVCDYVIFARYLKKPDTVICSKSHKNVYNGVHSK